MRPPALSLTPDLSPPRLSHSLLTRPLASLIRLQMYSRWTARLSQVAELSKHAAAAASLELSMLLTKKRSQEEEGGDATHELTELCALAAKKATEEAEARHEAAVRALKKEHEAELAAKVAEAATNAEMATFTRVKKAEAAKKLQEQSDASKLDKTSPAMLSKLIDNAKAEAAYVAERKSEEKLSHALEEVASAKAELVEARQQLSIGEADQAETKQALAKAEAELAAARGAGVGVEAEPVTKAAKDAIEKVEAERDALRRQLDEKEDFSLTAVHPPVEDDSSGLKVSLGEAWWPLPSPSQSSAPASIYHTALPLHSPRLSHSLSSLILRLIRR